MEREIKFKAKKLSDGSWVSGYYYQECGNTYIIEDRQNGSDLNRNLPYEVDPSTVCQYTGLKDWEGREVWEHDIALDAGEEEEVIFLDGCFQIHNLKHKNHDEDVPLCRCGEKGMIINTVLRSKFDKEVYNEG